MDCVKIEKQFIDCPVCGEDSDTVLYQPWVGVCDPAVLYGAASGIRGTLSRLLETTGYKPVYVRRFYQILQIGYLEDVANQLEVPLSVLLKRLTPGVLQGLPISYYASQTTALARINK